MGFSNAVVGGSGILKRQAIQSPNYVTGVSGWAIKQDGSAEFTNITLRGQFVGNNWVINDLGEFFYSGPPALGNLEGSAANTTGIDQFGNQFFRGVATYKNGFVVTLIDSILGATFQYQTPTTSQGGLIMSISSQNVTDPVTGQNCPFGLFGFDPVFLDSMVAQGGRILIQNFNFTLQAQVTANVSGGIASKPYMIVQAPEQSNMSGHLCILLQGTAANGSSPGQCLIATIPTAGAPPTPATAEMVEIQGSQSAYALKLVNQGSAPTVANDGCALYTDTNGFLKGVLQVDGNTYDVITAYEMVYTGGATISSVDPSFTTLGTANFFKVVPGNYEFEFDISYNTLASTSGIAHFEFATGATITHLDSNWQTYQDASSNGTFHGQTGVTSMTILGGPTMTGGGLTQIMKGIIYATFSTSGTITFQAATTVSGQTFKVNHAYCKIRPFNG